MLAESAIELHADWNDLLKVEYFRVLLALLPGLLTAAIVYGLTVRKNLTPVERVIEALLYTFLANFTWVLSVGIVNAFLWIVWHLRGMIWSSLHYDWYWSPTPTTQLICLGVWGVIWGIILTWVINCGKLHNFLAWLKLTKRASRPNEWYDAFYRFEHDYVVAHLKDGRRAFGWPVLYPDLPDQGHLVLEDAEWLPAPVAADPPAIIQFTIWLPEISSPPPAPPPDSTQRPRIRMMIPAVEVQFIEFVPMKNPKEGASDVGKESGK